MVAIPARAEQPANEYYTKLAEALRNPDTAFAMPHTALFEESTYAEAAAEISAVMNNSYIQYCREIWPDSETEIAPYAASVKKIFDTSDFAEKASWLVRPGQKPIPFYAVMCNSLAYGAEAIDISENQDVFGMNHSLDDAFYFIGHEYIIFLLKHALSGTDAFRTFHTWNLTEGLAEFYLKQTVGDVRFFNSQQSYADDYMELYQSNHSLTALDLFSSARGKYR